MTIVPAVVLTTACLLVISAADSGVVNGAAVAGFCVAGAGAPRRCASSGEVSSAARKTPRAERRTPCMEIDYSSRRSPGLKTRRYRCRGGIVCQVRPEPSLGFLDRHALALSIRFELVATDPSDIEVLG